MLSVADDRLPNILIADSVSETDGAINIVWVGAAFLISSPIG
jgi:hypothetical protein